MSEPGRTTFGMLGEHLPQLADIERRLISLAETWPPSRLGASMARDAALIVATGRWEPGRADPTSFCPGDVPAIRSIPFAGVVAQAVLDMAGNVRHDDPRGADFLGACAVYAAQPFFLDRDALAAVVATEAPPAELLADLRLPFPRVLVVLGEDLPIVDPTWSERALGAKDAAQGLWKANIGKAIAERGGGAVCAVVLFARDEANCAGLDDIACWLVSAAPDPTLPPPADTDRQRGSVWGLLSAAEIAPLAQNLALVVASATWREMPDEPPGIGEPGSDRWARSLNRHRARRALLAGAGTGVRVIDLAATAAAGATRGEGSGRKLAPHPRRGHWRRSRVATRDSSGKIVGDVHGEHGRDWHYAPHWIPPVVVGSGEPDGRSVWRVRQAVRG